MQCRQCRTEIAEKALICYRCGAATTEARFKPPRARRGSARRVWTIAILAVSLVLLALFLLNSGA